jgi:hypothetical protein
MRYVLCLRRWLILAKAIIVMALIIDVRRNSVIRTGNQPVSSVVISLNGINRLLLVIILVQLGIK